MAKLFADITPLKNPYFRRLWLANIITVIGGQLTVVAVPAQIFALTGSSGYVGLTGLFGLVPLVIFGLYGGAIADAFDKRHVLTITTLGLTASTGLFWLLTITGNTNVWLLLGTYSIQQGFFAVNQPTRTAIFPRILGVDKLPAAVSLNMTVMQAGALVGPLLAGVLLPFTGFSWLYGIDALSLAPTLLAVLALPPIPPNEKAAKAGLSSVVEGLTYLATQPVLLASFALDFIAMGAGLPRALFPEIATSLWGEPIGGGLLLSLLYAAMSLGAVLGGVFSGWVSQAVRQGRAVYLCILAWGVCVIGMGVSLFAGRAWAFVALAFLAAGGMADMFSSAFRNAILQQSASDELQGRIQGAFIVVVVGGPRLGDFVHGGVSEYTGAAWATLGGGATVVALTLLCVLVFPQLWRYERPRSES
ncbi:MAG: MFS transporter [Corynebacterium sp.]|nr:MFS transporter [Corynebacterium sp.]